VRKKLAIGLCLVLLALVSVACKKVDEPPIVNKESARTTEGLLAAEGQPLPPVTEPPAETFSRLQLAEDTSYPLYDAVIELYGVKDSAGSRELVVFIESWEPQDALADDTLLDLTGRNALMLVKAPSEEARLLDVGGRFSVQVRVIEEGTQAERGRLSIIAVK